jgi:hypothetical protein
MSDNVTNVVAGAGTRPTDRSGSRTKSIQVQDIRIGLRASPVAAVLKFIVSGALAGAVTTALATLALNPIAEWLQYDVDWDWGLLVRDLHFAMERFAGEGVGLMASGALGGAMGGLLTAIVAAYWKRAETPMGAMLVWVIVFIVTVLSMSLLTSSVDKLFYSNHLVHLAHMLVGVVIYGVTLGIFIQAMNHVLGRRSSGAATKLPNKL